MSPERIHHLRFFSRIALALSVLSLGCSSESDNPTTPETPDIPETLPALTAPTIVRPERDAEISTRRPELVAEDASSGGQANYLFQVSTNSSFDGLVTASGQVSENAQGRAVWQVPVSLADGVYYWRVQGQVGSETGPFATSNFTIDPNAAPAPPPPPPPATVTVDDPLTNGMSVGQVSGGQFTAQGWQVTSPSDFIRYELGTIESGFVEWENTGLRARNSVENQFMLLGMWDPTKGRYRTNPFRVHVQKLDDRHNPPFVRLRWIANGEEHDGGFSFLDWSPSSVYQWRLEWGPEGDGHVVRLMLEGQTIIRIDYDRAYNPSELYVELGIEERAESVVGAIFRNVRIGPR